MKDIVDTYLLNPNDEIKDKIDTILLHYTTDNIKNEFGSELWKILYYAFYTGNINLIQCLKGQMDKHWSGFKMDTPILQPIQYGIILGYRHPDVGLPLVWNFHPTKDTILGKSLEMGILYGIIRSGGLDSILSLIKNDKILLEFMTHLCFHPSTLDYHLELSSMITWKYTMVPCIPIQNINSKISELMNSRWIYATSNLIMQRVISSDIYVMFS